MKVLQVHNRYQQPGGELRVFESEGRLLAERGHAVVRHELDNRRIDELSRRRLAMATLWNAAEKQRLRRLLRAERPDVVHFHNIFPLISPAAYYAAAEEGVPVIQTLHNYRLLCANALLFRDGKPCEMCLGRAVGWQGVAHACYRGSRTASAGVVAMQSAHRALGTWRRMVDVYVALSQFAARKFAKGGLPSDKIVVKPNHVTPDPGAGTGSGGYVLFVGRLSAEKGLGTLLRTWREEPELPPLLIIGDGPLAPEVRAAAGDSKSIRWLGVRGAEEVLQRIGQASCLVFPSECYENCPTVIVEALAKGTPVIAASGGAAEELVEEGRTGALFPLGDDAGLARAARTFFRMAPEERRRMREPARQKYLRDHSGEAAYTALLDIYQRAIQARRVGRGVWS